MKQCTTCQRTNYHDTTDHSRYLLRLELLRSRDINAVTSTYFQNIAKLLTLLNVYLLTRVKFDTGGFFFFFFFFFLCGHPSTFVWWVSPEIVKFHWLFLSPSEQWVWFCLGRQASHEPSFYAYSFPAKSDYKPPAKPGKSRLVRQYVKYVMWYCHLIIERINFSVINTQKKN